MNNFGPALALDTLTGNETSVFKSIAEQYPWLAIDYEQPRIIETVTLVVPSQLLVGGSTRKKRAINEAGLVEIRAGNEHITTFGQPLYDRNTLCATIQSEEMSGNGEITVKCNTTLMGRYLTVQLMGYGSLVLDEVTTTPEPGL